MFRNLSSVTGAVVFGFAVAFAGPSAAADMASAEIVNREGDAVGQAELTDTPNGVIIELTVTGLADGVYAFHIHETGVCAGPFKTAGGHLNPDETGHGFADDGGYHTGDLPNIHVTGGRLELEVFAPEVTLRPGDAKTLMDDDGAALVMHAGPDDYRTDPAGAAGERIACGVIISQT